MRPLRFAFGQAERDARLAGTRAAMAASIADVELREDLEAALAGLAEPTRNVYAQSGAARRHRRRAALVGTFQLC